MNASTAPDFTPRVSNVQHVTRADAQGQFKKFTQFTYYVGAMGPFYGELAEGQDSAMAINAAVQAKVNELRLIQGVQ